MKCPLMSQLYSPAPYKTEWLPIDCLKEECAWWDDPVKRCLLLNISEKLSLIYLELNDIVREIPHEKERLV